MSYVVSARKYRPQTFEEVVGQEHITTTLKNALLSDKLAHAFLFCGPRGVGKTTCARLLAKVINMPNPKEAIMDGSYADSQIDISLNIIELDAASNNSVEHIRTLTEQVRFQPQHGKYKVFIIDEVHMLSQAAFNAFLKTLEEPPPYAIFILATTEKHKILPTILSRCQLYDFRRILVPQIIDQLKTIAERESINYDDDGLFTIAEKADGAMRDALSIFDRISSSSQKNITYKAVIANMNLLDFEYYFKAINHLLSEDSSGILLLLDEILSIGFEGDVFINGLARHMRNLLYCKQESTVSLIPVSDHLKSLYFQQASAIHFDSLLTFLHLANDCDIQYPKAKDKRLHIELALLKMCFSSRRVEELPVPKETLQKKTAEIAVQPITEVKVQDPVTSERAEKNDPTGSIQTPETSVEPHVDQIVDLVEEESTEESPPVIEENKPIKDALLDTPVLSSIQDLLQVVEVEKKEQNGNKKELELTEARMIWDNYGGESESPTTQAVINQAILEVHEDRLKVMVPTNIAKEEIQQETELYSQIREHFNQNDLIVDIVVDREKFPDTEQASTRRLYTTKEKYDHLMKQNSQLGELISGLNLQPDQDA